MRDLHSLALSGTAIRHKIGTEGVIISTNHTGYLVRVKGKKKYHLRLPYENIEGWSII